MNECVRAAGWVRVRGKTESEETGVADQLNLLDGAFVVFDVWVILAFPPLAGGNLRDSAPFLAGVTLNPAGHCWCLSSRLRLGWRSPSPLGGRWCSFSRF